jgi:uncharacterized protein (DUF1501 family)
MLVQPTTPQIFAAQNLSQLPPRLFSHSDQANQWQAAIPSGTVSTGWGGRVEDVLSSQYNSGASFTPVTATSKLRPVLYGPADICGERAIDRHCPAAGQQYARARLGESTVNAVR